MIDLWILSAVKWSIGLKPGWFGTQRSQKPRAHVTHLRAQTPYRANISENPWVWLVFTQRDGSSRLWASLLLTDGPASRSERWSVTERRLLTVTVTPHAVFMRHFTRARRTLTSSCLTNDTHVHWSVCAHVLLSGCRRRRRFPIWQKANAGINIWVLCSVQTSCCRGKCIIDVEMSDYLISAPVSEAGSNLSHIHLCVCVCVCVCVSPSSSPSLELLVTHRHFRFPANRPALNLGIRSAVCLCMDVSVCLLNTLKVYSDERRLFSGCRLHSRCFMMFLCWTSLKHTVAVRLKYCWTSRY